MAASALANIAVSRLPRRHQGPARAAASLAAVGVAVETFAWMNRHAGHPAARVLSRPGHELQRFLGTREPAPDQLEVARAALAAGASIVNDVSALRFSPGIAELAAETGAGLVLMHMRGEPRTMQRDPRYDDLLAEVGGHLLQAARRAEEAGVDRRSIVVDPGIGFGKTPRDSWRLLTGLLALGPGYPVLVGHSRKSFLDPEGHRPPGDRLPQSLAAGLLAALNGAAILRVHDVEAHARMLEAYRGYVGARE
jgi:dihydropteroate synthase